MLEILFGLIIIAVLILALSGKGRVLLRGFSNKFFEDTASTPEGADAIYSDAINKAQKDYATASDNLNQIAGVVETTKRNLSTSKNAIENLKKQCVTLIKAGRDADLDVVGIELTAEEENAALFESRLEEYLPMLTEAKEICGAIERKLTKLKAERKVIVKQITLNKQTTEMYDSLDNLKKTNSTDKLLDSVKEGALASREKAVGAKTVYENKNSTKLDRINRETKAANSNAYIDDLKAKYKK